MLGGPWLLVDSEVEEARAGVVADDVADDVEVEGGAVEGVEADVGDEDVLPAEARAGEEPTVAPRFAPFGSLSRNAFGDPTSSAPSVGEDADDVQ